MVKLHLGCGDKLYNDWENCDNSISVVLARFPIITTVLHRVGIIKNANKKFIDFCRYNKVRYCDITKRLPYKDDSVEVIYTSHVLEHLSPDECDIFLKEAYRVLKIGGTIRTCLPDLKHHVDCYLEHGNADRFVDEIMMASPLKGIVSRVFVALVGHRHHQWMYDADSFCEKILKVGFSNVQQVEKGIMTKPEFKSLDLSDRYQISFYVEAIK